MENLAKGELGKWLKETCQRQRLSLRQAANKTGLSHTTIAQLMKGTGASPQTIRKLATAFNEKGKQRWALEDKLLSWPVIELIGLIENSLVNRRLDC